MSENMRNAIIAIALTFTSLLHGYAFAIPNSVSSGGGRSALETSILKSIRDFRFLGEKIPAGSECERILVETGRRLGGPLTGAEIDNVLQIILKATGETLEPVPAPGPTPSSATPRFEPFCFTAGMKVLTPTGERPIGELKPGDEVVSIDSVGGTMKVVTNKIAHVFPHHDEAFGRLSDLPRPIEVTRRHQFWVSTVKGPINPIERSPFDISQGKFLPIEELSEFAGLAYNKPQDWAACAAPKIVPRGEFKFHGKATVFDLQLEGEPRNFIVEGVLVHNVTKF